jgi:hypothetical protein
MVVDSTMADPASANRAKAARHREKLREQGYRPIQISVHDTLAPEFLSEARRQSVLIFEDHKTQEMLKFVRAIAAWR